MGQVELIVEHGAGGKGRREGIERALREAIGSGRLQAGIRLPSSRVLAGELGIARGCVAAAYTQLVAEGYLVAASGAGTSVAHGAASVPAHRATESPVLRRRYDMSPFRPSLAELPRRDLARSLTGVLREAVDEDFGHPPAGGLLRLRNALAGQLGRVRGVRADAGQVIVTSGVREGLSLLWTALAQSGARSIAIERPGWRGVQESAMDAGLSCVPVAVDADGMRVEELPASGIDAVALAPAHQYPLGAVLSPQRRAWLIQWAKVEHGLVVEDDYDAEYRYDRHPVGALQGLAPEAVVFASSASKTVAPALRLGWLVVPHTLVRSLRAIQSRRGSAPSPLLQSAFAQLLESGTLDRHLRRQRRLYAKRRALLLAELKARLPDIDCTGAQAGLFVSLALPRDCDLAALIAAAHRDGIEVTGVQEPRPLLAIGYANLAEPAIAPACAALAAVILRQAAA